MDNCIIANLKLIIKLIIFGIVSYILQIILEILSHIFVYLIIFLLGGGLLGKMAILAVFPILLKITTYSMLVLFEYIIVGESLFESIDRLGYIEKENRKKLFRYFLLVYMSCILVFGGVIWKVYDYIFISNDLIDILSSGSTILPTIGLMIGITYSITSIAIVTRY